MKLSKFKISHEDEDSYHVTHPNGKQMFIDKHKLSDKAHKIIKDLMGSKQHFDEGGTAQPDVFNAPQDAAPKPSSSGATGYWEPGEVSTGSPESPQQPQAPVAPDNSGSNPYEAEKQANIAGAKAAATMGAAQSGAITDVEKQVDALPSTQDITNKYAAQNAKQYQAMQESKIDPNRYLNNMDTGHKIASGLSMILSGFGGGAARQTPLAAQMIENAINRDIESQKADINKAHTLWSMNRQAMGDDLSANLATKNQMYLGLKYKLDKAAANYKGPQALAAQQATNALIDQRINTNNAILGVVRGDPGTEQEYVSKLQGLQRLDPNTYKEVEGRYIPGVGVAKIPATPENKSELTNYDSLGKGIDKAINFQNNVAGKTGVWTPQTRAQAEDIKNGLILSMGKLNDMKRPPSPEIMKLYNEIVGGIGSINMGGTIESLKGLKEQTESRKQSVMNNLGVTTFQQAPTHDVAVNWARQNPTDPRAKKILQMNGIQ